MDAKQIEAVITEVQVVIADAKAAIADANVWMKQLDHSDLDWEREPDPYMEELKLERRIDRERL
jgi:hypothetical protein